jgi:hypothetical protein
MVLVFWLRVVRTYWGQILGIGLQLRITDHSIALDARVVPIQPRTTLVSEGPRCLVAGEFELEGDGEDVRLVCFGVGRGDCDLVAAEGAEPVYYSVEGGLGRCGEA